MARFLRPINPDLCALIGAKLLLAVLVLLSGYRTLSGDEAARALLASEWIRDPDLFSLEGPLRSTWLPLPFWLDGALLGLWEDIWVVPIVARFFFGLLAIFWVYRIGTSLHGRACGFLAAAIFAVLPWTTWLALSAASEPIYHAFTLAGLYGFVRWQQSKMDRYLWIAAITFLLAGFVRPLAWSFAGVWAIYIVFGSGWAQRTLHDHLKRVLAGALACAPGIVWIGLHYFQYGDPLHILAYNRSILSSVGLNSSLFSLLAFPVTFVVMSPFVSIVSCFAVYWAWKIRAGGSAGRGYMSVVLGALVFLGLAGAAGLGTTHAPQRYVLIFFASLSPIVASFLLFVLRQGSWRRLVAIGLLAGFVVANISGNFLYVDRYYYAAKLGLYLRTLHDRGNLSDGDLIVSEFGLRWQEQSTTEEARIMLMERWSESAVMQVFSNIPRAFLETDTITGGWGAVALKASYDAAITDHRLKVIIVRSPSYLEKIPARFELLAQIGPYFILSPADQPLPCPATPLRSTSGFRVRELGQSISVEGIAAYPKILPNSVLIKIARGPKASKRAKLLVRAKSAYGSHQELFPTDASCGQPLVSFPSEMTLPPGEYEIEVGVSFATSAQASADPATVAEVEMVSLGSVTLLGSKRAILAQAAKTGQPNWEALGRLVLSF